MSKATEPKIVIEPSNWKEFLTAFSMRNYNRRARFDVFRSTGKVEEEEKEARLEDIALRKNGNKMNIEVIRIDRSEKNAGKIKDMISDVIGVAVQLDTDGSEDALEITDERNDLISLRLESRVDGAS